MTYHNRGYVGRGPGTSTIEVGFHGSWASHIKIHPADADVLLGSVPDMLDEGVPAVIPAGENTQFDGLEFTGFTITRPVSTRVRVWWW